MIGELVPMKNAGRYLEQFVKVVVPKGSQPETAGNCMAGIGGYNGGSKGGQAYGREAPWNKYNHPVGVQKNDGGRYGRYK